jgi:hypothetical protein
VLIYEVTAADPEEKETVLECAKVLERVLRSVSYGHD